MSQKTVKMNKSFFRKERDHFYSDWYIAFWRELFQNSNDAGARNIAIELHEENGRSSFGEIRNDSQPVVRVVFADDGCGMSYKTLDDVYFSVGETTKSDSETSVGGFGRARLMTCFSQDRYSILTKDNFVMGDGNRYEIMTFADAEQRIKAYQATVDKSQHGDEAAKLNALDGLKNDMEIIQKAIGQGGYAGCRVEIDLETTFDSSYHSSKPATLSKMYEALERYLMESQLKSNVTINGMKPENYFVSSEPLELKRGRSKGKLVVEDDSGVEEFATVYVAKKTDKKSDATMIVRVDGAAMFSETIGSLEGVTVILEIEPKLSRKVLNSNRDGLSRRYNRAVRDFNHKLAIDVNSALLDKTSKDDILISGEHGVFRSEAKSIRALIADNSVTGSFAQPFLYQTEDPKKDKTFKGVADLRKAGLNYDAIVAFMESIRSYSSVLDEMHYMDIENDLKEPIRTFLDKVRSSTPNKETSESDFLNLCPPELLPWLVRSLSERLQKNRENLRKEHEEKLHNMHDVVISVISTNDKTKPAVRRNNPNNWDKNTGNGKIPHALLTGWTTAVSISIEQLMDLRPNMQSVKWRTGFVYKTPEMVWESDALRPRGIEALHRTRGEQYDAIHEILLNPVNEDGKIAYSISRDEDIWKLFVNAVHEVSHIAVSAHTEDFANLSDDIMRKISPVEAIKRIKKTMAATAQLYDRKNLKIQAMDNEPGPRPAERLIKWANSNNSEADTTHEFEFAERGIIR